MKYQDETTITKKTLLKAGCLIDLSRSASPTFCIQDNAIAIAQASAI
ncbi:hypothetical protein [Chamaesiphon sp.]